MSDNPSPNGKRSWKFCNAYLQKKEKEFVRSLNSTDSDFVQALSAFMLAGYKVSVSFDAPNDTFLLSITGGPRTPAPDQNKAITFRHRELEVIRSIACYAAKQGNEHSSLSRCFDPNEDTAW